MELSNGSILVAIVLLGIYRYLLVEEPEEAFCRFLTSQEAILCPRGVGLR
jgi:hypothetical protein